MKLCKDCAHFVQAGAKCGRTQSTPDYVYGKPTPFYTAQVERESVIHSCGPEARHFQPIQVKAVA